MGAGTTNQSGPTGGAGAGAGVRAAETEVPPSVLEGRAPAPGTARDRRAGGLLSGRRPLVVLIGAFAVSRSIAAAVGVRYDDSPLRGTRFTDMWQLLDVRLLRGQLAESVWHLNSQPPLFNLYCGVVLKLPLGLQRPFEVSTSLALGLVIVLCAYQLLVELDVPAPVALAVVVVCIVASPSYLLFENWLDYAYPTAAFGTFAAWCLVRYLRTRRPAFGFGFFGAYGAVVLLNSTYQIEWFLIAGVVVVVVLRRHWRQVVVVAVVPLILVLTWYGKNLAMFGTTTTSSWLGMNLARSVLFKAPPSEIARLQRQGVLTALATVAPFGGPDAYVPRFVRARPNSVAAVGALYKSDGATNFNNPVYISVSSQYLRDDIAYIRARPLEYVGDVNASVQTWLVSPDQNFTNSIDWPHLKDYARLYDRVVEWQPVPDPAPALQLYRHTTSPLSWISLQAVVVTAIALIGGPVLAWRRRRTDTAVAGAVAVMWWTTFYAFAASSLLEIDENERFRFELGPIPLILATVIVTAAVRGIRSRRSAPL